VNILYALEQLGEPWTLQLTSDCLYHDQPGASLRADSSGHIDVDCGDFCNPERYTQALLGALRQSREARR
jgi:hypothetical protein